MVEVMFLCSGNSCRSQMAEGFARVLGKGIIESYSVGLKPAGVSKKAEQVMNEFRIVRGKLEKRVKDFIKEVQHG